ncbi:MAG: patatin-like phospholipase family protein [Hyphomicrobiales bacterium]|nr:patatin-like phospholipase family protein [Hyphomicrobiales bacterium]
METSSAASPETKLTAAPEFSFGLALGGGGARGFAHIGVLEAVDELGIRPAMISGTSIGALLGSAYASGMSGEDIRAYCDDLFLNRTAVLRKLFSHWNDAWFTTKITMTGSPFSAENIITALLPPAVPATFEELKIPFHSVSTDFHEQSEYVISSGALVPAVAASCALPAIFRPVQTDGRVLIDGGFVNVVPFDLLCGKVGVTGAVDVTSGPKRENKVPSYIDTIIGSMQITMRSIVNEKLQRTEPDIFIRPDMGQFGVLEFYKYQEICAASVAAKDEFKRACEAVLTDQINM